MDPTSSDAPLVSPYEEAWQWIQQNPGTGSAKSLAKLLLSLWNHSCAFSIRECLYNLDDERTELALRIVIHFSNYGEDRELIDLGYKVCDAYPLLWDQGEAATQAKHALRETGRSADKRSVVKDRAETATRNQGIASLRELAAVAQRDSGQCRYIARFLAGLYNGPRFPFDLTDFRAIDDALWEHCMAVLRLDRHPEKEVHGYFVDGSALWENQIIRAWDLDRHTALHAALLLARYLERSDAPGGRQLADQVSAWRRENDPSGF